MSKIVVFGMFSKNTKKINNKILIKIKLKQKFLHKKKISIKNLT